MTTQIWNAMNDLNNPPVEGAVLTERGWEIPLAGTNPTKELTEVIVAIGGGDLAAGAANIKSIAFADVTLAQGAAVSVVVVFNEKVNVTNGATITISAVDGTISQDPLPPIVLTAAAHTGKNKITFSGGVAPSEAATLYIEPQTITGTIVDKDGGGASSKVIDVHVASAVGIAEVA